MSQRVLNYINFNVCESPVFDLFIFFKLDWWEQGSTIRNNVIISVSGAEGLSSPEMLAPAGIYTYSPTIVVEVRASFSQESLSSLPTSLPTVHSSIRYLIWGCSFE